MNVREQQLKEADVRRDAPDLNPSSFLNLYINSNFPQTISLPSKRQLMLGIVPQEDDQSVKSNKKIPSGTSYDNPANS
jgi:hypothetical protein